MKIYLGHSSAFDFQNKLYQPIKDSLLWQQHEFILPHENSLAPINTQELIKNCDLFIAEVSYPSTGLGIELGWASFSNRPVFCLLQKDFIPSSSLKLISTNFIEYLNSDDLIIQLENHLAIEIIL